MLNSDCQSHFDDNINLKGLSVLKHLLFYLFLVCFSSALISFLLFLCCQYLYTLHSLFSRAKMYGSLKVNVPSEGSHQRPTPEVTTVTPRVTRSSSRRVRFSDDSGVAVVPSTPDLETSEKMVSIFLIQKLNCPRVL